MCLFSLRLLGLRLLGLFRLPGLLCLSDGTGAAEHAHQEKYHHGHYRRRSYMGRMIQRQQRAPADP